MEWKVGDAFDEAYEIKSILEGGMADVFFLGRRGSQAVDWAAKSFKDVYMQNDEAVVRFWHEAQSWIELGKHRNIVYAHRVFEVRGKPYIYLEYMAGGSLRKLAGRPMTLDSVFSVGVAICTAMEYAYTARGLIHRDLKPENVLLGASGEIKVTDWGLSKIFDSVKPASAASPGSNISVASIYHTRAGSAMGTPPYMPPEQFENAHNVGRSADIYSLGIMLYEMLAGRLPFAANSMVEYYNLHKQAQPKPLSHYRSDIPKGLEACVRKAMEKEPRKRFDSFSEFGDELLNATRRGGKMKKRVQGGVMKQSSDDLTHKGFGMLHLRRDKEAIAYFDQALQLNPRNFVALGYKSYCLGNLGNHRDAIEAAKKSLEINPSFAHAWANLGFSFSKTGQHDAAFGAYQKAIALEPDSVIHYNNICIAFQDAGRHEEAIAYARKGLKLDPEYYRLWVNLAASIDSVKT